MKINLEAIKDNPQEYIAELLKKAVESHATDIHLSPQKDAIYVFYRIQGKLVNVDKISHEKYKKISYIFKQIAKVNTISKQPQDGRIAFKTKNGKITYARFASIWSEPLKADKIALRITDKDVSLLQLENLSYTKEDLLRFKVALNKSFGFILVVGPTGSGKTTTLYAAMNYIKTLSDRVILTIEDPVEFVIDNTVQIEISENTRFDDVLRNFLRQDPDIIMIGEIRDSETADVAVRAALTGHLVLSTLHSNTALLAITRMADLGADEFNLCSVVVAIQAQRLVKKLCPYCRKEKKPSDIEKFFFEKLERPIPDIIYAEGSGCDHCIGGLIGRTAVYELICFDAEDQAKLYRMLKESNEFEKEYTKYLKEKYNHKTLLENAADLIEKGIISVAEGLKLL